MSQAPVEPAVPEIAFSKYLAPERAAFIDPYSITLPGAAKDRLARALADAIELVVPAIREVRMVTLIFGKPPWFAFHAGTGTNFYCADMSLDPIATASHHTVFFDAMRLAGSPTEPVDQAVLCILEELVHVWMNVRNEDVAKLATAKLLGGLVVVNGQYLTPDQARGRLLRTVVEADIDDEESY